jgi:hypothetical protein
MKVKKEIIEAIYNIEGLTKEEFEFIKESLTLFDWKNCYFGYQPNLKGTKAERANKMLEQLHGR